MAVQRAALFVLACVCTCARVFPCVCACTRAHSVPSTVNPSLILAKGAGGRLLSAAVPPSWPAWKLVLSSPASHHPGPAAQQENVAELVSPGPLSFHTRTHRTCPDFLLFSMKL